MCNGDLTHGWLKTAPIFLRGCFWFGFSSSLLPSHNLTMSSKDPEKEKEEQDKQVELWKVKKLIKSLMLARG